MRYISENQIATYLRLKKELAQFRGRGTHFEDVTFDWFCLYGTPDDATVRLIRSRDEGDQDYCDVMSFSTINDDDDEEDLRFNGTLKECLSWVEENGGKRDTFVGPGMIDRLYESYKTEQ